MTIKARQVNKCSYGYSYSHKCNKKCRRKENKYIRKLKFEED